MNFGTPNNDQRVNLGAYRLNSNQTRQVGLHEPEFILLPSLDRGFIQLNSQTTGISDK